MCKIIDDLKKVVKAIDLILTNQQNDFLIQCEERKIRQPKRCKDDLYAKICCQVSPHAIQQIQKQVEKSRDALDKNVQLLPCTESFRKTMALPCAHEIH